MSIRIGVDRDFAMTQYPHCHTFVVSSKVSKVLRVILIPPYSSKSRIQKIYSRDESKSKLNIVSLIENRTLVLLIGKFHFILRFILHFLQSSLFYFNLELPRLLLARTCLIVNVLIYSYQSSLSYECFVSSFLPRWCTKTITSVSEVYKICFSRSDFFWLHWKILKTFETTLWCEVVDSDEKSERRNTSFLSHK